MTEYTLFFGNGQKTVDVPQEMVVDHIKGPRDLAGGDGKEAIELIREALASPVGKPRLREMARGRIVGVLVPDEFRAGHHKEMLQAASEELRDSGYKEIRILVSTGSHDPHFFTKNLRKYFKEYFSDMENVTFLANDIDNDEYIDLGTTKLGTPILVNRAYMESDLRVFLHEGKFHYMNGYSVIDKLLLPGQCALATIENNHKLSLDSDRSCAGRNPYAEDPDRRDNPFANDIHEAYLRSLDHILVEGELLDRKVEIFGLDIVSTEKAVIWVQAGDVEPIEMEMAKKVDEWALFPVERTKYVIISPGPPPSSLTIYGVQNCMDLAMKGALLQGGEALIIAPCEGHPEMPEDVRGISPSEKMKKLFWDNLVALKDKPYSEARNWIEQNFVLGLWKTNRILDLLNVKDLKLHLYCDIPDEKITPGGFIPVKDPQAWIDERVARADGKFNIIDRGNKVVTLPK